MITHSELKTVLDYDPLTGIFTWKVNRPPRGKIGHIAGYDNNSGYIKISLSGKRCYAHRLAFLWMTGEIPKEIDHINQCKWDNRWCNLRPSNRAENTANVAGRRGVRKKYGRWYARYADKHLGVFSTENEAINARKSEEMRIAGRDPHLSNSDFVEHIHKPKKSIKFKYKNKTLSEWSRITGIPQPTLHWRIFKAGMSPEKALNL